MSPSATIRVAAAQLPAFRLSAAHEALIAIEQAMAAAAKQRVQLLVLPECAYPAYVLGSEQAYRHADTMGGENFVRRLRELAAHHRLHVVCGFVDDSVPGKLFNAAVVIDADGDERGRHRKLFLWGDDNAYFKPGESLEPVDTPLGRIGVIICADGRAPEISAGLVKQGASLIAVPTCWVNVADRPGQYRNAQAEFMLQGRALECGVPFVAANKFGRETSQVGYCGWSQVLDAAGNIVAQAPPDQEALIVAEVTPVSPAPLEVPDWAVRRIFSTYPPVLPQDGSLGRLHLALVPSALARQSLAAETEPDVFEQLAADEVQLVVTAVESADEGEQLELYGRTLGMTILGYPYVERLMMEEFGSFGCMPADRLRSFVPSRVMALDGAAIVFVMGGDPPLALLRTRAAENRVFVASAGEDSAVLVSPNGAVLATVGAAENRPLVAEIDLCEAAGKLVYANTHIWQQRRPARYAQAFGVEVPFNPLG
jgi:predicted amidohydrolase